MRHLCLFASAIVIVGVAAYTLTLSFTQTTLLMSQIEALANGEGGESGDGGETGGENPESGGKQHLKVKDERKDKYCPVYEETRVWTIAPDGTGGWSYNKKHIGMAWIPVIECEKGNSTCTPYDPC